MMVCFFFIIQRVSALWDLRKRKRGIRMLHVAFFSFFIYTRIERKSNEGFFVTSLVSSNTPFNQTSWMGKKSKREPAPF